MTLSKEKYVAVTTFRRTGVGVSTATWIVPLEDGRIGFWTSSASGKYKRLRNDPRVTVQPADSRGRPRAGSALTEGTAEIFATGAEFDEIQRKVRAKYGAMVGISRFFNKLGHLGRHHPYGDTAIVITVAAPAPTPDPTPADA
jgi:PPOX class probable F420-dependent enzyme